ncbi:MAG TPA: hypothetical protein VJ065_03500 [Patescibacteria group bacterium]|nr:hypothetical protein [Patescibacteria group bacterium]
MTIDEPVTVGLINNIPKYMIWKGRNYTVSKVGLHHSYHEGRVLCHVFSVTAGTLFLRLKLNTDNLLWRLQEVENGI